MIQFNELKIVNNGTKLIIDVSINPNEYFNDLYITRIAIDNQDSYKTPGEASSKPVYNKEYLDRPRHLRLELTSKDLTNSSLDKSLFFVYVYIDGEYNYPGGTPEEWRVPVSVNTVCNLFRLYKDAMGYVKELDKTCETPIGFTDYILRLHALNICIRTGNYNQAIKYWNKFFNKKPCECTLKCK